MSGEESSEYKRIYSLVYDWGIKHDELLDLKTENDEIKHFGKKIKDFTWEERKAYEKGCYDLEYHFEVVIPHRNEMAAECYGEWDDEWNDEY